MAINFTQSLQGNDKEVTKQRWTFAQTVAVKAIYEYEVASY